RHRGGHRPGAPRLGDQVLHQPQRPLRHRRPPPTRPVYRPHDPRRHTHTAAASSGKSPTKFDRSAAYGARWVAKTVVAAGLASRCEVQLAYAIGVARPVNISVETFGTEQITIERIQRAITETFDLRRAAIMRALDLRKPIFKQTAAYGHFGRTD